jgi:uncharacterized protein (DUF1330 family)
MTYYTVTRLTIKDLRQFKEELGRAGDLLGKWGIKKTYVNRDVDAPSRLIVVHAWEDLQKARDFYRSPDFKQCAERAGIIGEPEVTFMEELIRSPEPAVV